MEVPSLLRTNETLVYNSRLKNKTLTETKGIKFMSIFIDLNHYNVIDNNTVDPMHDILEGCVPNVLSTFFNLVVEKKKITFRNKL